eukprot:9483834-Pyramimonas_sp.AAC.1
MVPEAELLINHVTTKGFSSAGDMPQEFKDSVEALKNAIARVEAEKKTAVAEVAEMCAKVVDSLESDPKADVSQMRAAMADIQKAFNGPAGAAAALRKKMAELRGKLQKKMQEGCKTTKMDKLREKLHAAAGEVEIKPDAIGNIKYLKNHTYVSNGGDINLGAKAFEGKAVKLELGSGVIKKIEDSTNFKTFLKWFTDKVSTEGAGKISNSAGFNNPSLLRGVKTTIKDAEALAGYDVFN